MADESHTETVKTFINTGEMPEWVNQVRDETTKFADTQAASLDSSKPENRAVLSTYAQMMVDKIEKSITWAQAAFDDLMRKTTEDADYYTEDELKIFNQRKLFVRRERQFLFMRAAYFRDLTKEYGPRKESPEKDGKGEETVHQMFLRHK